MIYMKLASEMYEMIELLKEIEELVVENHMMTSEEYRTDAVAPVLKEFERAVKEWEEERDELKEQVDELNNAKGMLNYLDKMASDEVAEAFSEWMKKRM